MSDFSSECNGSVGENFEGSESDVFLEVEIDGQDYLEHVPTEM